MIIRAWHGTNQAFDSFDPGRLGMNNPNTASRSAFFFALLPETAIDYAQQAARHMVPDQAGHERRVTEMLEKARRAERRGDFGTAERLSLEAEEIETRALRAEPSGSRILGCSLYLENPLEVEGTSREVFCDLGAVLERAQAAGHDAVIIRNIADRPSGAAHSDDHVAVFDPGRIRIDEVILEENFPCDPNLPEPF